MKIINNIAVLIFLLALIVNVIAVVKQSILWFNIVSILYLIFFGLLIFMTEHAKRVSKEKTRPYKSYADHCKQSKNNSN